MKIYDGLEQGTNEWHAVKSGLPTASNFDKILTAKGEKSKSIKTYIYQLVGERILGRTEEGFKSDWMERGNEIEDEARSLYEFKTDNNVDQVGFIRIEKPLCGGSPDGLVGDDGGLEIKCPKLSTHIKYALAGKLPSEYHRQVMGYLFITGRAWWDFMSYYPGVDPFIIRVYPDKAFFEMLKISLIDINHQINDAYNLLMKNDENQQNNDNQDTIPSIGQWSPAAQKIIDQIDKLATAEEVDKFRASKRKMILGLGDESTDVFGYIETAYQGLKGA